MDISDFIVIALLAVWVIIAAVYMVRRKKKGKSITCGGDCANCAGCSKRKRI